VPNSLYIYLDDAHEAEELARAKEIAAAHDTSISQLLRRQLRRLNKEMADYDPAKHKQLFHDFTTGRHSKLPDAETLRAKMNKHGWTQVQAAKHYKVDKMTVWRRLNKNKETIMQPDIDGRPPGLEGIINMKAKEAAVKLTQTMRKLRQESMQSLIQAGKATPDLEGPTGDLNAEPVYKLAEGFEVCPFAITSTMIDLVERALKLDKDDPVGTLPADCDLCIESYRNFIHNQQEAIQTAS